MSKPKGYVDPEYLRSAETILNQIKKRSYTLMQIQPNQQILDMGCGPGTDTLPLTAWVGETGLVVGGDYDHEMLVQAEQRAQQAGLQNRIRHHCVNALQLPYADNRFDACRSERLFQHLSNPAQALAEMHRVTKSGGQLVVLDTDWGSWSTDSDNPDLERRLARFTAEQSLFNGFSGRNLYRLFKQQKLEDISIEVFPITSTNYTFAYHCTQAEKIELAALQAGVINPTELADWHNSLTQADSDGTYFSCVNFIMIAGRKA